MPGCIGEGIVDAAGVLWPGPYDALSAGGRIMGGCASHGPGWDSDRGMGPAGGVCACGSGRATETGDAG